MWQNGYNSRACPGKSGTNRTAIRFCRVKPPADFDSLTMYCVPWRGPSGRTILPPSPSCSTSASGNFLGGGGHDDAVERRLLRRAGKSIARQDGDIGVSQRLETLARRIRQRPVALDAHDFAREPRQDGGLVARAGANFQDAVLRLDLELFGHVADNIGLADGLSASDRQGLVSIGTVGELGSDEVLARHLVHGAQYRLVADAAPAQRELKLHALHVGCPDLGHNDLAQ